ncbi:MAG: MotA/TolQ/ExbB proton channel family protein [Thermodesulfobacteriota bacterium]|nr:MotA/TolQ/ExbB proton channel family protein [Thermodesulfobacteriota bacterium]
MQNWIYRLTEYFQAGGPVMIPLLILSIIMWFLIINRTIYMRRLFYKNMPRRKAGEFVKMNQVPDSGFQGVNALLVKEFLAKRSHDPETDAYILDETVMNLVSSMDRYLAVITALSGIAPLLGLLGTVTGMITTFDVITVFGTGNSKAMAGGISEALITTQTGLLISIPGFYMSGFLNKRSINLKHRIAATGMYLKRYL